MLLGTQSKLGKDAGSVACFARVLADLRSVRTQIQRSYACAWSPHSVFSLPAQRPSRPLPGRVQGAHPIEA
jgi:hypothetical protein